MNFKKLAQHLVTDTCPLGEGFELTWDANKFTGECFRRMGRTYQSRAEEMSRAQSEVEAEAQGADANLAEIAARYGRTMEMTAISADISGEIYADVLASDRYGILHSWVLDDGTPPTFENLMQLPGETLKFIFDFCRENSGPKGEGTPTKTRPSLTTSEIISAGSSDPTTRSPESPSM